MGEVQLITLSTAVVGLVYWAWLTAKHRARYAAIACPYLISVVGFYVITKTRPFGIGAHTLNAISSGVRLMGILLLMLLAVRQNGKH